LDSEWTSIIPAVLYELGNSSHELLEILNRHGWLGTQFVRPPHKERLLTDLRQASNARGGKAGGPRKGSSYTMSTPQAPTQNFEIFADDPQGVGEYAGDILNQMRGLEMTYMPTPTYMDNHTEINTRMRTILVDWSVDVHRQYRLRPETLFLAVSLIDRYLANAIIQRSRLQLVGVTAMFVAAKFEEITPPEVADFKYICADVYTVQDILQEECKLLIALGFNIACPTSVHFLDVFLIVNQSDAIQRESALYSIELALLETQCLAYKPSQIAAASVLLTNHQLQRPEKWSQAMADCTHLDERVLEECMMWLKGLREAAPSNPHQAMRKKFQLTSHSAVADIIF